jgi:uncharacterized protein YvpB
MTSHDMHGNLDGRQGYILDGYGGVHPFGGAPALSFPAYWSGWDIARGLDVHLDQAGTPDGLLVIDGWGGLHISGNYPPLALDPPPVPGHDVYLRLERSNDGQLYAVTRYGRVYPMGSQNVSTSPFGGTHALNPYWNGYGDWGRWDILRTIALGRTDNPSPSGQPMSADAADELQNRVTDLRRVSLPTPAVRQDKPLDCEAASTAAALQVLGAGIGQDWVFSRIPDDLRPAVLVNHRPVRWGNPYTAFVGNVYGNEPNFTGYGVYDPPIASTVQQAGHIAFAGIGWALSDVYAEVVRGRPVVVWTTSWFGKGQLSYWTAWDGTSVPYTVGEHAVVLYGLDPGAGSVQILDVATGTFRNFSMGQFAAFFSTFGNMAVVVG